MLHARTGIPAAAFTALCLLGALAATLPGDEPASAESWSAASLKKTMEKLKPLHQKLGTPKPGEWLYSQKEAGQTFDEYLRCRPVVPTEKRRTIYVQPLGDFTEKQRQVIALTADYIALYFNLPVKTLDALPLSVVPDEARRTHPQWGDKQVLTTWVLDKLLKPRLPADAFAIIAFTSSDLWPGENWNFVFGQASTRDRVGVWSIYRFGDPAKSDKDFQLALRRTMALGTHELGHMFSIDHCIAWECNMCGCNSLSEADRRPIEACPECMAKICWATHTDPAARFAKLRDFCTAHGFKADADRWSVFLKAIQ